MKTPADPTLALSAGYRQFIEELKARVVGARISAARAVSHEATLLYWDIGRVIVEKQQTHGWGDSVVEMVASDLRHAFPGSTSFSADNVWRMRQFYLTYSSPEFLGQLVPETPDRSQPKPFLGQAVPETRKASQSRASGVQSPILGLLTEIPWGQNLLILKRLSTPAARLWYLRATARFGWSRNVLLNQIKAGAYERAVTEKKTHNFELALPEHFAEQADEMLKSSYNLEFLGLRRAVRERELEDRLVTRLQAFLLELRYGFCFVGRQHRIALGKKEYFIDLLFYHRFLKALVAFDLKVGPFEPEFAGKMDFYLNLLNDQERGPGDHRHHPLRGKGRRGSRVRPPQQSQPHRRRRLRLAVETPRRVQRQTPQCETVGRGPPGGDRGRKMAHVNSRCRREGSPRPEGKRLVKNDISVRFFRSARATYCKLTSS
jgi:predicted nuclease of restriction endonuclease-like (RecB) superfamily